MDEVLPWLLASDPSIVYQTRRDLLGAGEGSLAKLRRGIGEGGWAGELLGRRGPDGHWGNGAYVPKWTCTHYVLFELAQLGLPPENPACRESCLLLLGQPEGSDGGVNYARTVEYSDVCINGMLLGIASYFRVEHGALPKIVDYLLRTRMPDGGWNCEYLHDARHSSMHTTIAVLEGLEAYLAGGGRRRRAEVGKAIDGAVEFLLEHRLFRSDRTGEVIRDEFLKFAFPVRWKYDILRCLDDFRAWGIAYDERMREALDIVEAARGPGGRWRARSQPGKTYFTMEANGRPGRWNTLRALRVLVGYGRLAEFA